LILVDEGRPIDHTQPIRMFDGVKIVSRYLEARYDINPDLISETKLKDILEIFEKNGGTITVEELYEYMSVLYKKDKNFYNEKLITETKNLSENLNLINKDSKPFGQYGEVTLNELGQSLKENLKHLNDIR
jgi:hypothetical protein